MPRLPTSQVRRGLQLSRQLSRQSGFLAPTAFVLFATVVANIYHRYWSHGTLEKDITKLDAKVETYHKEMKYGFQDMKSTMHMMWAKGVYEEAMQESKKGKP